MTLPAATYGHWAPLQAEDPTACLTEAPPSALPSEADLAPAAVFALKPELSNK